MGLSNPTVVVNEYFPVSSCACPGLNVFHEVSLLTPVQPSKVGSVIANYFPFQGSLLLAL